MKPSSCNLKILKRHELAFMYMYDVSICCLVFRISQLVLSLTFSFLVSSRAGIVAVF